MAADINDSLQQLIRELRDSRKVDDAGARLSAEEQKKIIVDLLTPFTKIVEEQARLLKEKTNELDKNFENINNIVKNGSDPLKEAFQEFLKLEQTGPALDAFIKKFEKAGVDTSNLLAPFLKQRSSIFKEQEALEAKKNKAVREEIKQQDVFNKMLRHHEHSIDSFFNKLGVKTFNKASEPDALYEALNQLRQGGENSGVALKGYFSLQGAVIKKTLDPLNLVLNLLSNFKTKSLELLTELDNQTVAFFKATGQIGDYGDAIRSAWGETRTANVTLADMSQQFISLFDSVRTFTTLSRQGKESLAEYGALAQRLGADGIGKAFSFFMDSMKESTAETKASVTSLLGISKTTGESLKKITNDFLQALPTISVYGKQANSVFIDLFATAKALKIETSALLEISKGYDTFDEAATKVGRLNAVLGGPYLNTLQLMNQTEGERVRTLYQAFKATGQTWEQLPKYTKLAIANAAGINDMTTANAVFSGSLADVSQYSRKAALNQAELAEKNKRAATLQEKWNNLLSQLSVVVMPVLDALHWLVTALIDFSDAGGKYLLWGAAAIYMTVKVGNVLSGLKNPLSMITGFFSKIFKKKGAGDLVDKVGDLAGAADKSAAPVAKAGGIFSKFGNVMTSIGKGIGGIFASIAEGISTGAQAIAKGGGAILEAAGVIAAAFAIIAAGVAVGMTAFKLITNIGDVFANMWAGIADAIYHTATPMEELGTLIGILNNTGADFAPKMFAVGMSIGTLADKLSKVNQGNVQVFSGLMDNLSGMAESFKSDGIGFITSIANFMGSISDIKPTTVQNVSDITKNIVQMSKDVTDNKSINAILDRLTTLIGGGNTSNQSNGQSTNSGQMINLTVKIGDDTIDKRIIQCHNRIGNVSF